MNLADVEKQLLEHAHSEKRRWQQIAQLLMRVDSEGLWKEQAPSFTAWVQGIARRADMQQSVFWRCLKAGRIYTELTGELELPAELRISAESLELTDKILRHAPKPIASQVLDRALDGEMSRTELRDVWATYRPAAGGTTARGRLPEDPDAREEAIAARKAQWESERRKPENRVEVARAEIVASFRAAEWLGVYDQARAESHLNHVKHVAAVLAVRRLSDQPERLELHALVTCTSGPELSDYDFKPVPGADFMWLGVPATLADAAVAKAPRMAGVLSLGRDRSLKVARTAQRRPLGPEGRVQMLAALLQRAYLWP